MGLDPGPVGSGEEGDGRYGACGHELHGEDRVDFADELVADVEGCFCYAPAELLRERGVSFCAYGDGLRRTRGRE